MRKLLWTAALAVLAMVGMVSMLDAQAGVAGKVDTQWKCTAPNPMHALPVGDAPDHAYVVEQSKCTAAKGEVGGVKEKDGVGTEFAEVTGNTAKGHGIFVATLASGDKIVYSYTFTGVSKDNKFVSGSNKWTMTSGTGKFKGVTGSGTCTAKGAGDGSGTYDCVGTYTMPK
jgi:hypothetical protein